MRTSMLPMCTWTGGRSGLMGVCTACVGRLNTWVLRGSTTTWFSRSLVRSVVGRGSDTSRLKNSFEAAGPGVDAGFGGSAVWDLADPVSVVTNLRVSPEVPVIGPVLPISPPLAPGFKVGGFAKSHAPDESSPPVVEKSAGPSVVGLVSISAGEGGAAIAPKLGSLTSACSDALPVSSGSSGPVGKSFPV
jgi:hypothetical protein